MEQFTNNAASTLSAAITTTNATTLGVNSATGFPTTGNFRIIIDSEIMLVTGVSGTTFTVSRGQEGTTAATHLISAPVTEILTAGALAAFRSDSYTTGTTANLPTAGSAGRIYGATDGYFNYFDNGSSMVPFGPIRYLNASNIPSTGSFSWVNQQSATAVGTYGGIFLSQPSGSGIEGMSQATWGSGKTCIALMRVTGQRRNNDGWLAGLLLHQPGTNTNAIVFGPQNNNTIQSSYSTFTSGLSGGYGINDGAQNCSVRIVGDYVWMKLADDGSTYTNAYYSFDGANWDHVHQFSRTLNTGGSVATNVGFCVAWGNSSADPLSLHLLQWSVA